MITTTRTKELNLWKYPSPKAKKHSYLKSKEKIEFRTLRKIVRKLKFQSMKEYEIYIEKNQKPWPTNPNKTYRNRGWTDGYDFLGIKSWKEIRSSFPDFKDFREQVRKCKFKKVLDYQKKRKKNWPSNPQQVYSEFINWYDLLGKLK